MRAGSRLYRWLLAGVLPALCAGTPALAQQSVPLLPLERQFRDGSPELQRVALVLGLGDYRHVGDLRNARRDAERVAALLRENGFRVLEGYDLDKPGIERLLRKAVMAGGPGSELVVFFAGHGFQIDGRSYLLPVDAQMEDRDDVPFQTVSLDSLLATLNGRSRSQVVVLDACRNDPFVGRSAVANIRGQGATVERGLADPNPPRATLLAFSTAPGTLALDGDGANSPYTEALTEAARINPATQIEEVLRAVTGIVTRTTGGRQTPRFVSALERPFAFQPPPLRPAVPSAEPRFTATPELPGVPGDLVAPRERVIAIGARMLQRLNLDGAQVVPGTPPPGMSYGLALASGGIAPLSGAPVPATQLSALVLRFDDVAVKDAPPVTGIETHPLDFERLDPGGYRTPRALTLSLVPDSCDIEAGDWFDPQGVGIHRLDAALRPDAAIAACEAALRAGPDVARFRFQLGRALQAAGREGEADYAYRAAAEAGYVRAWRGLGRLLESRGGISAAERAYLNGQSGGDPRATAALGALRLKQARTPEQRDAAYELLLEGVDLGLWVAMEALAAHFTGAGSDPRRAGRFTGEAQLRRDDVDAVSVPDR